MKIFEIQIEKFFRGAKKWFKNEFLYGQVNPRVKNLSLLDKDVNIFSTHFFINPHEN